MKPTVLAALQGGLERLYRVETSLDVHDFLVGRDDRAALTCTRQAREQLLITQSSGELELALYVDEETLEHLEARDPRERLDDSNLAEFLLALEGVSHFVYFVHRARQERPVSAVELELQAEVDKYLVSLLVAWEQSGEPPLGLAERLYGNVSYHDDLSREERSRYELANEAAHSYAETLERRFVDRRAVEDLLAEARRFYRKGLAEKLEHISAKKAA